MRLGAQAVELGEGTRAREAYGERGHPRAPPAPLRGEQPLTGTARRRRARRLRDVPGGAPRRDRRAARPSLVRREPVPPGVQVAPDAAGAALPRVRRRRAERSQPRRVPERGRPRRCGSAARHAGLASRASEPPSTVASSYDLFLELGARPEPAGTRARVADRVGARARRGSGSTVGRGRRRAAEARVETTGATSSMPRYPRDGAEAGVPLFLCAHLDTVPPDGPLEPVVDDGHDPQRGRRRSSAPTTSRRSSRCSRRRAGSSSRTGRTRVSSSSSRRGGGRPPRRGRVRRLAARARLGFVYDQAAPIGEVVLGAPSRRRRSRALPRPSRARGDVPGGRPLGDRGGGSRDRGPPPRPDRRRDLGERRH